MTTDNDCRRGLDKQQIMILKSASRPSGMSYRSAANRGVQDIANQMVRDGLLCLQDTGREKGRFIFRSVDK